MKRVIAWLLAIVTLAAIYTPAAFAATDLDPDDFSTPRIILIEGETGTVLFEKNADEQAFPASTTKIMTCILALEEGNLDDTVYVPPVTERGSLMGIRRGERMSLRSLIYGMMLVSGNDAAEAIAVHLGGTLEEFVAKMNAKAKELGMKNTQFAAPSGLHKDEHYTTARDFAILTRYAMYDSPESSDFRYIIKKPTYKVEDSTKKKYELESTNKLIHTRVKDGVPNESFEYKGAIGVKTGSTPAGKECLVAAAERDGVTLIAVLFNEEDGDQRFKLARKLFDWGFENFTHKSARELGLAGTLELPVEGADQSGGDDAGAMLSLNVDLSNAMIACTAAQWEKMAANPGAITVTPAVAQVKAPVGQDELVTTVDYSYEGTLLFTADARASRTVVQAGPAEGNTLRMDMPGTADGQPGEKRSSTWLIVLLVLLGIALLALVVALFMKKNNLRLRKRRRRRHY